ncbi:MAG: hypothetical protein ABW001_00755 [Mycobacterium sp.]
MTTPPTGWQPDRQPGPFPSHHGQPPGFDPQPPPPPGWQQGPLQQPPQKGSSIKWLLIAVAVLLVIAISVGGTLLFTRDGGGGGETTSASSPPASDIASAGDTGPVAVITHEPTCKQLLGITSALSDVQAAGWRQQRATYGPASEWSAETRTQVIAVTRAITNAADQMVALAKETPHRVMRELYEQFVAYGRAYAASIDDYIPSDNSLADANVSFGNTLLGVCTAIDLGSANRMLPLPTTEPPSRVAAPGNAADPQRFLKDSAPTCAAWSANEIAYKAGARQWEAQDSNIPASQWTSEQRALQESALPVMTTFADEMESTGRQSGNPILEDFAVLGSVYLDAYVSTGNTYTAADSWLVYTILRLNNAVSAACIVAGG